MFFLAPFLGQAAFRLFSVVFGLLRELVDLLALFLLLGLALVVGEARGVEFLALLFGALCSSSGEGLAAAADPAAAPTTAPAVTAAAVPAALLPDEELPDE